MAEERRQAVAISLVLPPTLLFQLLSVPNFAVRTGDCVLNSKGLHGGLVQAVYAEAVERMHNHHFLAVDSDVADAELGRFGASVLHGHETCLQFSEVAGFANVEENSTHILNNGIS